jgi:hypothetical protein
MKLGWRPLVVGVAGECAIAGLTLAKSSSRPAVPL